MKNRLTNWLRNILGSTELEKQNNELKLKVESLVKEVFRVNRDYQEIIEHVKLINRDFTVTADVNDPRLESSVVLVMRRFHGRENIVKFYQFDNYRMEEIYRFVERFGKEQVTIDSPSRYPPLKFRY